MSNNTKYTVTFRMAEWRDIYDNPDDKKEPTKSAGGHLWYVLHKNDEFLPLIF